MGEKKELSKKEILKLQSDIVDIKQLYDNSVKENKSLNAEVNKLQARVLELQHLLVLNKEEKCSEHLKCSELIAEKQKEIAILEAVYNELSDRINNLNNIIEKLIENS